jgi:hypothetical protein
MSKPIKSVLLGLCVIGAVASLLFAGHQARARRILAKYKAELIARGEQLTVAKLPMVNVSNSWTSFERFTNALAKIKESHLLTPGALEPMRFVGPARAVVTHTQENPWAGQRTSRGPDWPVIYQELAAQAEALLNLRRALVNVPQRGASVSSFDSSIPGLVKVRTGSQWLMATTLGDLRKGDIDDALDNLEALVRMAQVYSGEPKVLEQMIRVAISGLASAVTWEFLQSPSLDEAQLLRLQNSWSQVDLLVGVELGLLGERAFALELWEEARTNHTIQALRMASPMGWAGKLDEYFTDYVKGPLYRLSSINQDELFFLRTMQEALNTVRAVKSDRPWVEAQSSLESWLSQPPILGEEFRHWLTSATRPNLLRACRTAVQRDTERRMAILSIAIKRYELRYGRLPEKLNSLVPEIIASLPLDAMSGNGFGYRIAGQHAFVLYSVGLDGVDNGGDAGGPDTNWGLWTGPDAVWPSAAHAPNMETQASRP